MTQISFSGSFRIAPGGDINLSDRTGAAGGSAPTLGATLIDSVPQITPPLNQLWKIQAVELFVGLSLSLDANTPPAGPCYGSLGKILGGLITTAANTQTKGTGAQPFVNPIQPLPLDLSLISKLYDSTDDTTPPQGNVGPVLFVTGGLNLPQPIPVYGGQQIAIGLWLTPSLAKVGGPNASAGLLARQSRYTIIYDDGL